MEHLNAESLLGHWKSERHVLMEPRREPDTRWILEAALGHENFRTLSIHRDEVSALIRGLFFWRRAHDRPISMHLAHQRVNRVMEHLNQVAGIEGVLIPEPIPVHRPTALPPSAQSFSATEQMLVLDKKLLTWCRKTTTADAWLLVLSQNLMARLGMSEAVLLGTLASLTRQHIHHKTLMVPSSPNESLDTGGHYHVSLPRDVWIPLRAVLQKTKHDEEDSWLFATNKHPSSLPYKQRRLKLRQRLKAVTKRCASELKFLPDSDQWSALHSWQAIVSASRYVPVMRDIPPLWATLLRHYPLPTCTHVPLLASHELSHSYAPGDSHGRLPDRGPIRATRAPLDEIRTPELGQQTQPVGVSEIPTEHLPPDWHRQTKNILQQFLSEVGHLPKKRLNSDQLEDSMQEKLLAYEQRLNRFIGHQNHYPFWVLHFLYYQMRTKGNELSSTRTLLSRLTPLTLLMHDAVLDMSDWDDEVVLELQMAAESGTRWADSTRQRFISSFRQLMTFCQSYGLLEGVSLPRSTTSALSPSTLRTRILTPDHLQTVWSNLTQGVPDGDPRQMMGLTLALGFYGGLRASEVLSLTLNDVVMDPVSTSPQGTCWVEIQGGKTPAARRRVGLHIMAPPSVIGHMHRWIMTRRDECSAVPLEDIALFGPRHNPQAYTREALITPVIQWMRFVLGQDIDFHGLRHAAVSWTLLRLHAAQHEDFKNSLQHRHHWMFQPMSLRDMLKYFCGAERYDTLERGTLLLHVAQWIGHREPSTLLRHYAHTLGLIHSHVLAPSNS
ncbi:site-specific integrase [Vreelandella arcis]|uniref:Phage integrase family protein n=1 Tax=Vreelandella arcis TaxID=416873 RepID=A0A1H0IAB6_9GAMM|nr:site-specific integrase [Halomonas arcis]SDO28306.1 hypothetical protein SAMN04487951_11919 [Halomonas arcis]